MNTCPVCGYELPRPMATNLICPCCGTQFGYDDYAVSHRELLVQWLRAGHPWFSRIRRPPSGWKVYDQLYRANLLRLDSTGSMMGQREETILPLPQRDTPRLSVGANSVTAYV